MKNLNTYAITHDFLHSYFSYDPIQGILKRNAPYPTKTIIGKHVRIGAKLYSVSSIIWEYMTGAHADYVIRVDRDVRNNQWSNFSVVSYANGKQKPAGQIRKSKLDSATAHIKFRYDAETDTLIVKELDGSERPAKKGYLKFKGVNHTHGQVIRLLTPSRYTVHEVT